MTLSAQRPVIEIPLGSKEYVKGELTSDRELGDQVPDIRVGSAGEWLDAEWVGDDPATTRVVRTVLPVDFAGYSTTVAHTVWARFGDSPEVPIIELGQIRVTR